MFRVYVKLPDGTMRDRLVTGALAEAERHFARLCEQRTDGPAVAILQSPSPEAIPTRRYRIDRGYPDAARAS